MAELKADFHTHSADDPRDDLSHSTEVLLDAAAQLNFRVLALTCHEGVTVTERLRAYARRRGITLVPGLEACIEGKHVVILNPDGEQAAAATFAELRALGRRDAAFLAPHPYYPSRSSLGRALEANIDLFDAVEFCTLYVRGAGFNRRAVRVARKYGLPLIGTSDLHTLPYCDSTCTLVDAAPNVEDIVAAIRRGRVTLATRPRTLREGMGLVLHSLRTSWKERLYGFAGKDRRQSVVSHTVKGHTESF